MCMCSVNTYDDYMVRRFPADESRSGAADERWNTATVTPGGRFLECIIIIFGGPDNIVDGRGREV